MGVFSREQDGALPRWVDDGGLGWRPDVPLELEPHPKPRHDAGQSGSARLKRKIVRMFGQSRRASARTDATPARPRDTAQWDVRLQPDPHSAPEQKPSTDTAAIGFASKHADRHPAPDWLLHLGIGLAQGVALVLLLLAHDQDIWPGSDPSFSTALLLASVIAPLALLEGFDQVEPRLLLLWSGTLGFVVATLGLWQQWRGGLAVMPVATITLFVLLAHITVRAGLREGRAWSGYSIWTETAWTVVARLLLWGALTALAFVVLASCNGILGRALNLLGVSLDNAATLVSIPLLGMASAAGFAVAADGWLQRSARSVLLTCCAAALPILGATALAMLGLYLVNASIPHGALLVLAASLVVAVHAFDWQTVPQRWRKLSQGIIGFIILELALTAALDLHARVLAHGWTDMRIYATVAVAVLALYGLVYLAEGVSSLRGARAFPVMERACPALILLVAALCLLLSTPLFDPLGLAVNSQMARLERGNDLRAFDFSWLRGQGGRFGQEALARFENRPAPALVISAASQLPTPVPIATRQPVAQPVVMSVTPPVAMIRPPSPPAAAPRRSAIMPQPAPEPASADIVLHTAGKFPAALLAQDWSGAGVAPCLTKATVGCEAWLLDLDRDGRDEVVLAYGDGARVRANVLKQRRGRWIEAASAASPPCQGLMARVQRRDGPLPGWRGALRAGLRQRAGAPPARLPCPRS